MDIFFCTIAEIDGVGLVVCILNVIHKESLQIIAVVRGVDAAHQFMYGYIVNDGKRFVAIAGDMRIRHVVITEMSQEG